MEPFRISPARLAALGRAAGFDHAGIASVPPAGAPTPSASPSDFEAPFDLESWIDAGHAGEMEYLKRRNPQGQLLRSELHAAFPWAQSVIVCAANYHRAAPLSIDPAPSDTGWIARYAWSGEAEPHTGAMQPSDYHDVLLTRVRTLESQLKQELGPFESRAYVDTGPLIERVYAQQAGIGWVGRNTCILNQQLGSWLFLAVIVTSLPVAPEALPLSAADRCGTCRRCIDACPTGALLAPEESADIASRQMDASLCISYLTIEKRGAIPEPLRAPMGRQVFGCDICQDVCPWNRKAPVPDDPALAPRAELINPTLDFLTELTPQDFNRLFRGSPIKRAKHAGLRRNLAIAMGNSGLQKYLPRLRQWAAADDPVLAETAQWAIHQIETSQIESGAVSSEAQTTVTPHPPPVDTAHARP